jgi:hypothetical protein
MRLAGVRKPLTEDDIRRESEFLFRCYSDPGYGRPAWPQPHRGGERGHCRMAPQSRVAAVRAGVQRQRHRCLGIAGVDRRRPEGNRREPSRASAQAARGDRSAAGAKTATRSAPGSRARPTGRTASAFSAICRGRSAAKAICGHRGTAFSIASSFRQSAPSTVRARQSAANGWRHHARLPRSTLRRSSPRFTAAETEDPGKPKEDPRRHAQLEAELATKGLRFP